MIEGWQIERLVDKLKNLPDISLEYLRYMNGKFYHVSYTGRTSYPMTPNEIDAFVRRLQLIGNTAYRSNDNKVLVIYSQYYNQQTLEKLLHPIIATESNFKIEEMWINGLHNER